MTSAAEPELHDIAYDDLLGLIREVVRHVTESGWRPDFIVGVGRGGLVPAVYISHRLSVRMLSVDHSSGVAGFAGELLPKIAATSAAGMRLLFVDDINDSGGTIAAIRELLAEHGCAPDNLRFAVLLNNLRSRATVEYWAETIDRDQDKRWFVFPWEAVEDRAAIVQDAMMVPERLR